MLSTKMNSLFFKMSTIIIITRNTTVHFCLCIVDVVDSGNLCLVHVGGESRKFGTTCINKLIIVNVTVCAKFHS